LVVTPSVRSFPPEYFNETNGRADHVIIDDSNGTADRSGLKELDNVIYVDDAFQDKYLTPQQRALVPRRNPSCKNFGLIYAWREGYDLVVLLDDDTDTRVTPDFLDHVPVNKTVKAVGYHTRSGWANTMKTVQNERKVDLFARGYPYEHRCEPWEWTEEREVVSSFNEGMWLGTPDINGIDKLTMQPEEYVLTKGRCDPTHVYLETGQHLPLSIMNVQFKRDLIPAFYQPSDYPLYGAFRVRRHDDIWSSYFLKKVMDVRGDTMTFGNPLVYHHQTSNAVKEAISENVSNLIQPFLTHALDAALTFVVEGRSYAQNAVYLAEGAVETLDIVGVPSEEFKKILIDYFTKAAAWARLFD
jgi:hypothetical protein